MGEAIERSGPVHRLGARMSDIEAGLRSVQKRLEQRSPTVTQAKITQKVGSDEETGCLVHCYSLLSRIQ